MLKFRFWCFINKLKMIKANAKYKQLKNSGTKIKMSVLCDSFPVSTTEKRGTELRDQKGEGNCRNAL